MANLLIRLNKGVGRLLAGSGLVWLILVLFIGFAVHRFLLPPEYLPLARADFRVSEPDLEGIVLFSDSDTILLLRGSQLWWQSGEQDKMITDGFTNLLQEKGIFWLKTETAVASLDLKTGIMKPRDVYQDGDFTDSHLVAVDSRGYHLYRASRIRVADDSGIVSGPHILSGNRRPAWLEGDWRKGVLFYHASGWTIYRDYRAATAFYKFNANFLVEAEASPDMRYILFVLVEGPIIQLWSARADGSQQLLLKTLQARFSSLETVWSPTGHQVALALLGYSVSPLEGESFVGTTLLFEPVSGNFIVLEELNSRYMTLPIPSAWDSSSRTIYFYRGDTEDKRPIAYHLLRR